MFGFVEIDPYIAWLSVDNQQVWTVAINARDKAHFFVFLMKLGAASETKIHMKLFGILKGCACWNWVYCIKVVKDFLYDICIQFFRRKHFKGIPSSVVGMLLLSPFLPADFSFLWLSMPAWSAIKKYIAFQRVIDAYDVFVKIPLLLFAWMAVFLMVVHVADLAVHAINSGMDGEAWWFVVRLDRLQFFWDNGLIIP